MKISSDKLEERIKKAKTGLDGKEGVKLREARKKLKRLQRRKLKAVVLQKSMEEQSKKKAGKQAKSPKPAEAEEKSAES
ncbi:MAG: hypothetical protein IEMM0002_0892 [bacterium]|nr:MAG: hypothetical protein IEMM0002_0892 [bacterium]